MPHNDTNRDETESNGGAIIHLRFDEFAIAPQFAIMRDAPHADFDTCDTLAPDMQRMELFAMPAGGKRRFVRTAFATLEEFKEQLVSGELLFFHVFELQPEKTVLSLLNSHEDNERVLLFDALQDGGFLATTPVVVEITQDSPFISKSLAELRGLGAWAKGSLFGFETDVSRMASFIARAREFGHPPRKNDASAAC
ncbi:MAG: hypothetical protein HYR84_14930 [Planctomycetes bacterium]|nr:hypothetical protein [Planctomycetota bacterium]